MANLNRARVMKYNDGAYIDLADEQGHVVEIDQDGWRVTKTAPMSFLRTPYMLPLPIPKKGGSIDECWHTFDVSDDHFIEIATWLLDALRGDGVYPILTVTGRGAPLNPFTMLRDLVDPSSAPPFPGVPRSKAELSRVNPSYLFAFDNMPEITGDMSVAIRRLSKGHPMIARIDGSEITLSRGDHYHLAAQFEERRPRVLGLFYDAIAQGLRSMRTASAGSLSPHDKFSAWFEACKPALWPHRAPKVLHKETPI
jgi:hypothetical protein